MAANEEFRNLVTLHIRITLLSDVFATAGYAHGRAAIGLLQTLMSNTSSQMVADLGALHRASIWENIVFHVGLNSKGIEIQPTPLGSPMDGSPAHHDLALPEAETGLVANGSDGANVVSGADTSVTSVQPTPTTTTGTRDSNAAALKHLTHGLPNSLAPFFQGKI